MGIIRFPGYPGIGSSSTTRSIENEIKTAKIAERLKFQNQRIHYGLGIHLLQEST